MSTATSRRTVVVIGISVVAILGVVAWIAALSGATKENMKKPVQNHVNDLEQAAEAADKAMSK